MGKNDPRHDRKKVLKIAGASEIDMPKNDKYNIWDPEFGWVLKDGKPTQNTKAYWQAMRRKLKQ